MGKQVLKLVKTFNELVTDFVINYLSIYRFMILSLEDEEDQEELQDAGKIFFGNLNFGNKFKELFFFSSKCCHAGW